MSRELFQTALEFCHDLLAEWEWKKGERAGLGEEYNELAEFISTLNHEIVKPLPKPIGFANHEMFDAYMLEKGFAAMACKKPADIEYTIPLYAEPPARKWLTNDEIEMSYADYRDEHGDSKSKAHAFHAGVRFAEEKHGITDPEQSKPQSNAI